MVAPAPGTADYFMAGHFGLSERRGVIDPHTRPLSVSRLSLLPSLSPRTLYAGLRSDAFDCTAPHQGQLIKSLIQGEACEGISLAKLSLGGKLWIR